MKNSVKACCYNVDDAYSSVKSVLNCHQSKILYTFIKRFYRKVGIFYRCMLECVARCSRC